jgi:hypothetical protein
VGDVCSDGSLFAGFMLYNNSSCEPLFVADIDQTASAFGPSPETSTTNDYIDGRVNHEWIVANKTLSNYPAFEECENLNRHGHTDWYLPAVEELQLIWINRVAIGGFSTNEYWPSTESDNWGGWNINFANGMRRETDDSKANSHEVRCVRRD